MEVERVTGSVASKADAIAYAMKKSISERMDEDPVYYKKFSELIDDSINDFLQKRISEAEYLATQLGIRDELIKGNTDGIPEILQGKPEARAFYGILKDAIKKQDKAAVTNQQFAKAGTELVEIVSSLVIRDWKKNEDVQKKMINDIEDFLLLESSKWGVVLPFDLLDEILDRILNVAKNVY